MKKQDKILLTLQNHPIIKWLFFISAITWALIVIFNVIIKSFEISKSLLQINPEYKKLQEINIWDNIDYIVEIFWPAKQINICDSALETDLWYANWCLWINDAYNEYLFLNNDFTLVTVINKNKVIRWYSIISNNKNFKPELKLFLWRFIWYKNISLWKTKFSELQKFWDEDWVLLVEDYTIWNGMWSYLNIFHNDDYAVNELYIFKSWFYHSNDIIDIYDRCPFHYLSNFDSEKNDIIKFRRKCSIFSISVVNKDFFWEDINFMSNENLEEQLKNYTYYF